MLKMLLELFSHDPDFYRIPPKPLFGKRSALWKRVRAEHLLAFPSCAVCGQTNFLEVHHVLPFSKFPELELTPSNLITLCETPATNHHYVFGHLGYWHDWNPRVREVAAEMMDQLRDRQTRLSA